MTSRRAAGPSTVVHSMEDTEKLKDRMQEIMDELSHRAGDVYLYLTINVEDMSGKCQGSEVICNFINKNLDIMYELYRFCADAAPVSRRKKSKRSGVNRSRRVNRGKGVILDFTEINLPGEDKISRHNCDENLQNSVNAELTKDVSPGSKKGSNKENKPESPREATCRSATDPASQSATDPTSQSATGPTPQKMSKIQGTEVNENLTSPEPVDKYSKEKGQFECASQSATDTTSQSATGPTPQKMSKIQGDEVNENLTSPEPVDKYSKEKGQFECENCGLILSWKKSYHRHKRMYCTTAVDKPPDVNSDTNQEPETAGNSQGSLTPLLGDSALAKSVDESHKLLKLENASNSMEVGNESKKRNDKIEGEDLELVSDGSSTEPLTFYMQEVLQMDMDRDGSDVRRDGSELNKESQETLQYSDFHGVFYNGEDVSKYFEGDMSLSTREKGNFKCKKCGKVLQWKKSFVRHLLSSSCIQGSEQDNDFIPIPNENGKFKCHKCGVEMEWKKSLLRHIRSNTCSKDTKQNEIDNGHKIGGRTGEMSDLKENKQAINPSNNALPNQESITDSKNVEAKENSELDLKYNADDSENDQENSISMTKLADTFKNSDYIVNDSKLENRLVEKDASLRVGPFEYDIENTESRNKRVHKKPSICKVCNLTFPSKEKYLRHIKVHTTKNKQSWCHKCDICNKVFSGRLALASHRVIIHKKNETFHCRKCQHKFKSWNDYRQHFKRKLCTQVIKCFEQSQDYPKMESDKDNDNLALKCIECKRDLTDKAMVKQKKKYVCEICQKDFEKLFLYQRHKFTHTQTKSYKCHICEKSFVQVRYLYSHYVEVHKEKYSICKYCGMLFPFKSLLSDHMRNHHKVGTKISTCYHCNLEFESRLDYVEHLRTHSAVPYSICEICGKSFSRASSLKKHISTHSETTSHQCECCGKTLRSETSYKRHLQLHNVPDTRKKYQCDECGEFFSAPHVLRKHKLRHVEEPTFKCDTCSMKFRTKEGLNYHRTRLHITHNDVSKCGFKIRECKYCGKLISQKQTYLLHMAQHTGEKPYKCNSCDKSYALKALLNRHMVAHRKPYKCDICDTRFSCKSKWKRHLKTQKHITECQKAGIDIKDSQYSLSEDRVSTGELEGHWTRQNSNLESADRENRVTTINAQIISDQEIEQSVEGITFSNQKDQIVASEGVQQGLVDTNEQGVVSMGVGDKVAGEVGDADVGCIILSITPEGYENPVNISFNIGANEAVHMAV